MTEFLSLKIMESWHVGQEFGNLSSLVWKAQNYTLESKNRLAERKGKGP